MRISVELKPTEDIEKVILALKNIFGDIVSENGIVSEHKAISIYLSDLEKLQFFKLKIRERGIQSHVRAQLERNLFGNRTFMYLNKQVATVGRVSLCESPFECPLGAIQVELRADTLTELNQIIAWLTS